MNSLALIVSLLFTVTLPAREVELMTVSDTSFILTWVSDRPLPSAVVYGENRRGLDRRQDLDETPSRFHRLVVDGLDPGTTYYYRIQGEEGLWPPPGLPPLSVTTLSPPSGQELFTFAVMNDLHVGEDIAGVMILPGRWLPPITPGFTWRYPVDNYWEFTLRAAVAGINAGPAELSVANGDLTSWFTLEEFTAAKSCLDRLRAPYHVTRGNHDRVGDQPQDYFLAVFGLESSWSSFDHRGFHFALLDDNRLEDGWHGFPEEEWEWLDRDLAANRDRPTFVFCHRPVGSNAGQDINPIIRKRFLDVMAANPQVVAVFNAHSHRAKVYMAPELTGDLPFIEVPSTKEYPLGYGLVRVYEGGFMYNFYPSDCPDCREWRHVTRKEYFGFAPHILFRRTEDRNLIHEFGSEVLELVPGVENGFGADQPANAPAPGD